MTTQNPRRSSDAAPSPNTVAGCLGLCAFTVAIIAGVSADNSVETIMQRALLSMVACSGVGFIAGKLCGIAVMDYLVGFKNQHAIVDSDIPVDDLIMEIHKQTEKQNNSNNDDSITKED